MDRSPFWRSKFAAVVAPIQLHWLAVATIALSAAASLRPVLGGAWPANHDENTFLVRTMIFADHLREGDWLPVWSSADALGYGSPEPALYHKLFYLLSGGLTQLTGELFASVVATVWLFIVMGAVGQYFLVLQLTGRRWAATAGAVMLVFANYTVTNWMVRGALAELSAAMLIPVLLSLLFASLQRRRAALPLGVVAGLLILAHSVLAVYVAGIVGIAAVAAYAASAYPRFQWRELMRRGTTTLTASALVSGPYLISMATLRAPYDLHPMTVGQFSPSYNLAAPIAYLRGTGFRFGRHWHQISLEIDRTPLLWLAVAVGLALISAMAGRTASRAFDGAAPAPAVPFRIAVTLLGIVLTVCVLLQLPISGSFYSSVPGAAYLQFPWRLQALSTPALIALALLLLCKLAPKPALLNTALAAGVCIAIASCGSFQAIEYAQTNVSDAALKSAFPVDLSMMNEYLPATQKWRGTSPAELLHRAQALGCTVTTVVHEPEALTHSYRFACDRAATVTLPEVWSRAHTVEWMPHTSTPATQQIATASNDEGLMEIALPAGHGSVEVHVPTLMRALATAL